MIKQRYSRRAAAALIVSPDPLAAALVGPALMTDARLFFFGSARQADDTRTIGARYGVRLIILPDDVTRIREILTRRPSPIPDQIPR